jgi:hypothetical protein
VPASARPNKRQAQLEKRAVKAQILCERGKTGHSITNSGGAETDENW